MNSSQRGTLIAYSLRRVIIIFCDYIKFIIQHNINIMNEHIQNYKKNFKLIIILLCIRIFYSILFTYYIKNEYYEKLFTTSR